MLSLAPRCDVPLLRATLEEHRSVSLDRFLAPGDAQRLWGELDTTGRWVEIFRAGERVYEMPRDAFVALDPGQKTELARKVEDAAKGGLQYRYRAVRVSEDAGARAARSLLIDQFADLMNAPHTLDLLRSVTGQDAIAMADAQATDYRAGDFLTAHDDVVEGKNRLFAYVFSLTRRWQADWGGLLMFEDGSRVAGYLPDFNVLRLFPVPSRHHVSYVAPWVEARRLSITGWLRGAGPIDQMGS